MDLKEIKPQCQQEHLALRSQVSNIVLQQKGIRLFGEMTDPKTGSRNIQYEPGASCDNRK